MKGHVVFAHKYYKLFFFAVIFLIFPHKLYAFPWPSQSIDQGYVDKLNNEVNKYLPIKSNDGLSLTRIYVMTSNKTFNYYYNVQDVSYFFSVLPKGYLMDSFKYNLAGRFCFPKENKIFIDNGYTANFIYNDNYGNNIYNISINSSDCKLN